MKLTRAALLLCLLVIVVFTFRIRPASAVPQRQMTKTNWVDARADECRAGLMKIQQKSGMWQSYKRDENFGTVVVDSSYMGSSEKDKETVNGLMRCVLTNGKGDESVNSIEYVDSTTHRPVALWSPYAGLELE